MSDANLSVDIDRDRSVAVVEIHRPPNNYFDTALITEIADAFHRLEGKQSCRAIVLCSEGRHFCAGRNFGRAREEGDQPEALYGQAARLVGGTIPIVAAVQGAAVGGGLGLAMIADLRVAGPSSRFVCNFSQLGIHPGFGLSVTLPDVVGRQRAMELMYTGRRVRGDEAYAIGLCDRLVDDGDIRHAALELAGEIAAAAPLAVRAVRSTLRDELAERFRSVIPRELREQERLRTTADHREGVAATAERRPPTFRGE